MTDLSAVHPHQEVDLSFVEPDEELALVTWINRLLTESDIRRLAFGRFELERNAAGLWHGRAFGESWRETHPRGIEVKGATLSHLSVKHEGGLWTVRLVVDVCKDCGGHLPPRKSWTRPVGGHPREGGKTAPCRPVRNGASHPPDG